MKPLLHIVVTICLLAAARSHPENIEQVKELPQTKELVPEAEESQVQPRIERCTACAAKLQLTPPNFANLQQVGTEVHTTQSFEGCSSETGCAGVKLKDGKVVEKFGNLDALKNAQSSDLTKEFQFHTASALKEALEKGIPSDGPFWWMNQNSPFKMSGGGFKKFTSKSESYTSSSSSSGGGGLTDNIFLNGEFSKGSGFNAGSAGYKGGSSSSYKAESTSTFNSGTAGFGSSSASANTNSGSLAENQFLNGQAEVNKASSFVGYTGSSPRPFAGSTAGSNINLIQSSQKEYSQTVNVDDAYSNSASLQASENAFALQQTCTNQGYVCVATAQCINGVVNSGYIQSSSQKQYCNTRTEVCCRLDSSSSGYNSFESGSAFSSNSNSAFQSSASYGSSSNAAREDAYSAGSGISESFRPGANGPKIQSEPYLPPYDSTNSATNVVSSTPFQTPTFVSTPRPFSTPGYLPPPSSTSAPGYLPPVKPESSNTKETYVPPSPNYSEGSLILDVFPTGRPTLPPAPVDIPAGCAAALKCTPIEYCTAEGVISNTTVVLSREQEAYRVPMTDCRDVESGRIGKCCRDPYYTDPWPVNQIGKWVPGVFGGNDGKYVPDSRGSSSNNIPHTNGSLILNVVRPSSTPITPSRYPVTSSRPTYQSTPGSGAYVQTGQGSYTKEGQGSYYTNGAGSYTQQGIGKVGVVGIGTQRVEGGGGYVQQVSGGIGEQDSVGQGSVNGYGTAVSTGQFGVGTQGTYGKGIGVITGQGTQVTTGVGKIGIVGQGGLVSQGGGSSTYEQGKVTKFTQGIREEQKEGVIAQQGTGVKVIQGIGTGLKTGGGYQVTNGGGYQVSTGGGYGVENEASASVHRVFLQRYEGGSGQCGLLNPQRPYGNRNDLEVDFAEIPWQAMVLLQTNKSLLCGGVITRPDVVVTSAACVDGLEARNVLIKGGEYKLGIDDEPLPFQIVQVKHILRHPFYKIGTYHYDAAILVLTEDLRLAKNIYPICLPSSNDNANFEALYNGAGECLVTGWGKVVLQSHLQGSIMHAMNVSLLYPNECQAKLSSDYPHLLEYYDEESCVCGQPTNPINNICKVDIGSALACSNGDSHFVLRGVYSWDSGCQIGNQIGAFYKFDIEWYEWALGFIESVRFARFGIGTKVTQNKYTTKVTGVKTTEYTSGVKGFGVSGGGAVTGVKQFGTGFAGVNQAGAVKSNGGGYTSSVTSTSTVTKQYNTGFGGAVTGGLKKQVNQAGAGAVKGFGDSLTSQTQLNQGHSQVTHGGQLVQEGQLVQGGQLVQEGQLLQGGQLSQGGQFSSQFGHSTSQFGKFSEVNSANANLAGINFGGVVKGPITNGYTATYTEKKIFQSEPQYITYTTKPEIVTFTTKPEYFTFTTKPKYVTYTTKPEIITYTTKPEIVTFTTKPQFVTLETSGSRTNAQYAAPEVSVNQSFTELVGHRHTGQCKCLQNAGGK